jgi:uncharacterized protein (TIGR02466 family)
MVVDKLFVTPVYVTKLNDIDVRIVQKDFKQVYETYIATNKFRKNPEWESRNHSLSDLTFRSNFIEELDLKYFKKILNTSITHFMYTIGQPTDFEYNIYESWMTLTKSNESAIPHAHPRADIAGVYYYKTNCRDGNITFLPPYPLTDWASGAPNPTQVTYTPEVGKLLLFPGSLMHYVTNNDTDDDRVSVSFNIKFKR